uniref:Uncharacterized protein n=1 Tax=Aureoumbra lagunensis TaxID=44058 RepID=A0A7S3NLE0_9STRA
MQVHCFFQMLFYYAASIFLPTFLLYYRDKKKKKKKKEKQTPKIIRDEKSDRAKIKISYEEKQKNHIKRKIVYKREENPENYFLYILFPQFTTTSSPCSTVLKK